jgi:hypothetical protein
MNRYGGCTTSDTPLGDLGRLCHLISKVEEKKFFLGADEKQSIPTLQVKNECLVWLNCSVKFM